jgi:hypothetical protein
MDCKDVTEFIIVPAEHMSAEIWQARERFADYLRRRFPGYSFYSFRIARLAPIDTGDSFGV